MSSSRKGDRRERELVIKLKGFQWFPMRAPASGSATERELPDVIAGQEGVTVAGEAKTSDPQYNIYIEPEEVEDLRAFADAFGMVAVIFVRWDQDTTWYWAEPSDIPRTDGKGKYSVKPAHTREYWRTLEDLYKFLKRGEELLQ